MALYTDLLGHNLEKFAGVTVFDATFYDPNTGQPLITFDTLQVSNITTDASQKEIRGGQGAGLIASYDYGRTAEIEITDALASMYSLQYLWGGKLNNSGLIKASMVRKGTIGEVGGFIDMEEVADNNITFSINTKRMKLQEGSFITGIFKYPEGIEENFQPVQEAAFLKLLEGLPVGTRYTIYTEEKFTQGKDKGVTHSHVNELTLTSTDFPPIMRLVGQTFFLDVKTGKKVLAQVEIPRFKPSASFTFTFEAEGEASVFDFTGTALADGNEILKLKTLGYEDAIHGAPEKEAARDEVGKNPEQSNTDTTKPVPIVPEP